MSEPVSTTADTTPEDGHGASPAPPGGSVHPGKDRTRLIGGAVLTLAALTYVVTVIVYRFENVLDPWAAEGDWKQWIWQYWRYSVDGAFPPGQLLTDYAFAVQPPLWWAAMAALTTFVAPMTAAFTLNLVSLGGALVGAYAAVRSKANHLVAVAAVMLLVRDDVFFRITAGGYPRSFGPTLVLLFLAAWLAGRHRLVLVVLVLQAALYPPVVVPSGLAYGLWVLLCSDQSRVRRLAELSVAGVLVVVLGLSQSLMAPDWWGSVVTLEQAMDMPEMRRGGRVNWVPLPNYWDVTWHYLSEPFTTVGHLGLPTLTKWNEQNHHALLLGFVGAAALILVLRRDRFPLQLPLFLLCVLLAHFAARELAFRLYLPHRVVQHTLPYLGAVALPLLFYRAASRLLPTRTVAATVTALLVGIAPIFVIAGDGIEKGRYFRSNARYAKLYEFVRTLPVDAQFAGNLRAVDKIPLFGQRQAYVNWTMAHPFRLGFYAEIDRRIRRTYDALYATSLDDIVRFSKEEDVDYLVYDEGVFNQFESGWGTLFEPIRSDVKQKFQRHGGRFALEDVPAGAVIFRYRKHAIIDLAKLSDLVAAASDAAP